MNKRQTRAMTLATTADTLGDFDFYGSVVTRAGPSVVAEADDAPDVRQPRRALDAVQQDGSVGRRPVPVGLTYWEGLVVLRHDAGLAHPGGA